MRKCMVVMGVIALICVFVSPVMAGGVVNKSNLSADYFRSLTRNAATDAADIVAFNPAGVMRLADGFYTKLDVMYVTKDYESNVPIIAGVGENGNFESDEPSWIPGFFTVYKQDKWATFFAVTIPGGGGEVVYPNGNAYSSLIGLNLVLSGLGSGIDNHYLEANSYAIGYTLGVAYAIDDKISVAGGLRYVDSIQKYKGYVDVTAPTVFPRYSVDVERTADGWNGFFGFNYAPTDELNFGFLFMTSTGLDYKSEVKTDTLETVAPGSGVAAGAGWANGTSRHEDLPAYIGLGASYKFAPKWRAELNYTLYLERYADLSSQSGRWDDAGNSSDLALSVEYTFNPQWKASLGYMITNIKGMSGEDLIPLAAELDAKTIACGVVYDHDDRWRFNLGFSNVDYDDETNTVGGTNSPVGTVMDKHSIAISTGIQYRF